MHAIFGNPSSEAELYADDARERMTEMMDRFPRDVLTTPHNESMMEILRTVESMLWADYVFPHLQQESTTEGKIFWRYLQHVNPALAEETEQFCSERPLHIATWKKARRDAVQASRRFFRAGAENSVVRTIAEQFQYLPPESSVQRVDNRIEVALGSNVDGGRWEGLERVCGDDGFVYLHGERVQFPSDGPPNKYAALFDERPMFDIIRQSFIESCDPHSLPNTFYEAFVACGVPDELVALDQHLKTWVECPKPADEVVDFARRAWPAYVASLRDPDYWLCVEELVAISWTSGRNVIIFEQIGSQLTVAGGCFDRDGPPACCKIASNRDMRVRGHFEKLIDARAVGDSDTAGAVSRRNDSAELGKEEGTNVYVFELS